MTKWGPIVCLRSGCDCRTGQSRDSGIKGKQVAGLRLLAERVGCQVEPGGGRISGSQILPAERYLGEVRNGKSHAANQLARRRITPCLPAAEQADPDAPFGVDGRTVGIAVGCVDRDESP